MTLIGQTKGGKNMKKEYSSPEWELMWFSFEDIMDTGINVSDNENSGSDHNDDDEGEW